MKRFAWYRSITFKVTASLTLCAVLVTLIAAYINITLRNQEYTEDLSRWAYQLTETIKNANRQSMMANQSSEIQVALDTIGAQTWIDKVRIFGSTGTIAYSSDRTEIGKQLGKESRECVSCHRSDIPLTMRPRPESPQILPGEGKFKRVLSSIVPIENEPDCSSASCHVHPSSQKILGVLDVIISLDDFSRRIATGTMRLIGLSVVSILTICLLIAVMARFLIVRPVKLLLEGTEHVAKGNFEHMIPVRSRDELGALSLAFNRMTRELGSHEADLKRWVVTLEDKVKERTVELERTRMQLVQQEKMASLGRLSAGVAHEINNPLTSILVFSSILRDKLNPDHVDYKKVSTIVNETIRCREIVERLLEFSRQDKPKKVNQNINEIVEKAVGLLRNQAIFQNVRVQLRLGRNLPQISIDPNQIQQVFFNILINAADAMRGGGDLFIRTYSGPLAEGKYVVCEFEDTGEGIPAENLPRLFDPFFSTKAKGTGLGLSICYSILQRHDGKIEVQSRRGKGSTFTVKLPTG